MRHTVRLIIACPLMAAGFLVAALAGCTSVSGAELQGAPQERLSNDVKYLASDELDGRGVGTAGLNLAADYIRAEFERAGLDVKRVEGGAFQTFSMTTGSELTEPNELRFVGPEGKEIKLELGTDFNVCSFGGAGAIDGDIVFGGYAIDAKDIGYHDFEGVDIKGKVVVVMRRNPQQDNPRSRFATGHGISQHASIRSKISVCNAGGAAAILFVNDPHTIEEEMTREVDGAEAQIAKAAGILLKHEPGTDEYKAARDDMEKGLARYRDAEVRAHAGGFDELMKFGYAGHSKEGAVPVVHISAARCDELLKAALNTSLADLEGDIDSDLKPRTQTVKGWKAVGQTSLKRIEAEVKNVIAVLEGEGPLADETIVVGAHYDHVGRGGEGSLAPGSKEIHNGADDNASGTASLLEVARRLAARPHRLPRRVVFIAFTAEELGLIGSAKYVDKPVFPIEKTIAMYNMDMVGRLDENKLTVFGIGTSPTFKADIVRLGEEREFKLSLKPEGFGPSDQSSFYAKKIPVLHFFTGTHSDYHRPGDDWEKLNVEGMDRITGLVEAMVVHTAEAQEPPQYLEVAGTADVQRSGSRPYFGSIPDFGSEGKGYGISGVGPGSPAEKGGLAGGDRIIRMGDRVVNDLNDFDLALRRFAPGDEIDVVVLRKGEEKTLKVTLGKPR